MAYTTRSASQFTAVNAYSDLKGLLMILIHNKQGLYAGHYERRVIERCFKIKSSNYTYWLGKRIVYLKNKNKHALTILLSHLIQKFGMPKW
jgi:hypothetical protein